MPSSSLARVVQRPNFSWVTPYGTAGVNYYGGNRGAGLRNRIADETGDRTREFTDRTPPNPNLPGTQLANSVQKNLDVAQNTQAINVRNADRMLDNPGETVVQNNRLPGATTTPMGDLSVGANGSIFRSAPGNPGVPVSAPPVGDIGVPPDGQQPTTPPPNNPVTGEPSAMTPAQQAQNERDLFMARGGSEASMHRAQVAQGRRPAIDGRTVHSPGERPSEASMAAVRGFGDKTIPGQDGHTPMSAQTFGNAGSALWAQMGKNFESARDALRASLAPKPSTANVIPTPPPGETYQWPAGEFPGVPDYNSGVAYNPFEAEESDHY